MLTSTYSTARRHVRSLYAGSIDNVGRVDSQSQTIVVGFDVGCTRSPMTDTLLGTDPDNERSPFFMHVLRDAFAELAHAHRKACDA